MKAVYRLLPLDAHEALNAVIDLLLCLVKLRQVRTKAWHLNLVSEVILNRIRKDEVTISQALHQSRSTKTVSTVIREVRLTDSEETWDRSHQFVVYPDTTHRIVDSRIDHHWGLIGIIIGNLLIHLEEVTIACFYDILPKALNRRGEVEEDG